MGSKHCPNCLHYREGVPPDPLAGIRLVSKKVLEVRAKWEQELATRAAFEQERLESGRPFHFEPYSFAYCAHFSKHTVTDPVSGAAQAQYVLCATQNSGGNCNAFEAQAT